MTRQHLLPPKPTPLSVNRKSDSSISCALSEPPPESPRNIRIRTTVVLSFWAVVLFLGVPLWLLTTSIYRAPLPLKEMQSWADGRACRAEFPLHVDVEAPGLAEVGVLIKSVQHALDDANDFSAHHLRLRAKGTEETGATEENIAATLRLLPGKGGTHSYTLSNSSRVITLHYAPSYNPASSASVTTLSAFVANTLQDIFAEEQHMITHLLSSSSPTPTPPSSSSNSNNGANKYNAAEVTRKMSRIMRYSPTYHLTFSMFTGADTPMSWEIEEAIQEYFQPLLDALSGISEFTVDSQIQFYASLSDNVVPKWVNDTGDPTSGTWTLDKQDLSSFINSAEWPLVSITSYPTINFIVYIAAPSKSPLSISDSATNAFLLPQWGGVKVLNVPEDLQHLDKQDLKPILDTFAAQLLALLGAPSHPSSLPIRLDSLTRQRSAELLTSASSTLGSLYRLTLALPSIAIPSSVSSSVDITLESLRTACRELKRGAVGNALAAGRRAATEAERAFFEKSMVGQVYFPEEHKVAVYLPLLGPVGVPLFMSGLKEGVRVIRAWKMKRK